MKRKLKSFLIYSFLILVSVPLFSEQFTKVGILDIQKVYSIYFRESKAVKELQERQAAIIRNINRIDEEILNLEIEKLEALSRNDAREALKLDTEIFDKKQFRDDYKRIKTQQLQKLSEDLYQSDEFLDELLEAIQYVAESKGFTLVLNYGRQFKQFFFFHTKESNITELVIQELMKRAGKKYSGEG